MKLLLPVILLIIGLAGGLVGGQMMKPPPPPSEEELADGAEKPAADGEADMTPEEAELAGYAPPQPAPPDPNAIIEYTKLDKQFVVPIIQKNRVASMMVLALSIETGQGGTEKVFLHEPKLRDQILSVLFTHARAGGFDGRFTDPDVMNDLRGMLLKAARSVLGDVVRDVLITNILRQDQ